MSRPPGGILRNAAARALRLVDSALRRAALFLIAAYQLCLSPFLGGACRFSPTCSEYAREVFKTHSAPAALWLSARRIARCNPFCKGGEDPPPRK